MSDDVFSRLVALYNGLPQEPTLVQIVAAREAFGRLLTGYQPRTVAERSAIDDMADMLARLAESA